MDISSVTHAVQQAIAADNTFAAAVVFEDYGTVKKQREAALDLTSAPPGPGYNVSVWPPARGHSAEGGMTSMVATDSLVVVRFEVNPALFASFNLNPQQVGQWFTARLKAIVADVLGIAMENNGTKFQLASDSFELMNFDEGLVAYHIRFVRHTDFGT